MRKLRAIDLYSGIGGWSLGLKLAGLEVVASYEKWGPANETNFKNNHHQAQTVDIRRLVLEDLPEDIDVVVGSPPCTQFSYSNRGGGGDIEDGLEDIKKFLSIVDHLQPKAWAMENVPRVASILDKELRHDGRLSEFSHLNVQSHIINMEEFGLPQRRKRCIAGNFDFQLLDSYKSNVRKLNLGDVVNSLSRNEILDPIYGCTIESKDLTDHVKEPSLNWEEERINRINKLNHIIYNKMSFPDSLDRPVRTITATCTRVSRESIVIEDSENMGGFRRLSIRERASLQGFPITFQFYGANHGQKAKMIGNAIPPMFTYFIANSIKGTAVDELLPLDAFSLIHKLPKPRPAITKTDKAGIAYPSNRSFRFAVPSLQLKSGVRFEFRNQFKNENVEWLVDFYFGTSKKIIKLPLDQELINLVHSADLNITKDLSFILRKTSNMFLKEDIRNLQIVWSHKGRGGTHPFSILDSLNEAGLAAIKIADRHSEDAISIVREALLYCFGGGYKTLPGVAKLERNAPLIASGLLIGATVNSALTRRVNALQLTEVKTNLLSS